MMNSHDYARVCAVIVTYNRKELLLRNIRSLLNQDYPLDILIYDNCSPDMPGEYLIDSGLELIDITGRKLIDTEEHKTDINSNPEIRHESRKLKGTIYYYRSSENLGGAGGFCNGMQIAYESGYDYVWLMDDDGYCLREDTLRRLMIPAGAWVEEEGLKDKEDCFKDKEEVPKKAIWNSLVLCNPAEEGGDDTLSFTLFEERKLPPDKSDSPLLEGEINPFNGTLIPRELMDEIGFVNADLYIYGDEIDYVERAKKAGYQLITVTDSRYYHPDSGMGNRKVMGRAVGVRSLSKERLYYYTRNYMYIMRQYRTKKQAVMHIPKVILKTLLFEENGFSKLGTVMKALNDGWRL